MTRHYLLLSFLLYNSAIFGQLYQGPSQGYVLQGAVVNTNNFAKDATINYPKPKVIRHKAPFLGESDIFNFGSIQKDIKQIYQEDSNMGKSGVLDTVQSLLFKDFQGLMDPGNYIPPDPYIAAGPNHLIAVDNSRFAIYDKQGNVIKTISADSWYSSVLTGAGAFDPKVLYDHFAKKWIMVWLDQDNTTQRGYFLISVSDDSIPTGVWYNWALPSNYNGTTNANNWGDYQGVGVDSLAIYITSNQFSFTSGYDYAKIRIIPKSYLYSGVAGQINWFDLWDVKIPNTINDAFTIRPSIAYTHSNSFNLMTTSYSSGNYVVIYKIQNAVTNPSMTGSLVNCTVYNSPPNANQLGGGLPLIDGGGYAGFRFEPIYRNGTLWAVHPIKNPLYTSFSAIKFLKINALSNSLLEEIVYGANGFWYIYPSLSVDKYGNVVIGFSRSSSTEYVGAYYISRPNGYNSFSSSQVLQKGKANYVKTFGDSRNRWGDYMGMWLDPSDETSFWMITEFAASTNVWGTWIGGLKVALDSGFSLRVVTPKLNFLPTEINYYGDTLLATVQNFGNQNLVINGINFQTNNFKIADSYTFPKTLIPYETFSFKVVFNPKQIGIFSDSVQIISNASMIEKIILNGRGYFINPASENIFYVSSGNGKSYTIDPLTGSTILMGSSNFEEIKSISMNPKNKLLYGLITGLNSSTIVRVNSAYGDAYNLFDLPIASAVSVSFDSSGTLWIATKTGLLYKANVIEKTFLFHDTIPMPLSAIAFNPKNNELWGTIYKIVGAGKDIIAKINLITGDTTEVGQTGFGVITQDIEFDGNGNLYGIKGMSNSPTELIKISQENGIGTLIGSTNTNNLTSLAYSYKTTGMISQIESIPDHYFLSQNYPNPFNPITTIEIGMPNEGTVKLTVFNTLGETVTTLSDDFKNAGTHKFIFDASNLPSGVYFYELKINSASSEFNKFKKMLLIK
jgi:hypothetical protein